MDGITGGGNELHLTNSSDALTKVDGLIAVNRPNLTVNAVDSTDQDSNGIEEFIAGNANPGQLSATVKYVPGSATDDLLLEHLSSKAKRAFKIVLKTDSDTTEDVNGSVVILSYEPDEGTSGELRTATVTGQISGATTQAATA